MIDDSGSPNPRVAMDKLSLQNERRHLRTRRLHHDTQSHCDVVADGRSDDAGQGTFSLARGRQENDPQCSKPRATGAQRIRRSHPSNSSQRSRKSAVFLVAGLLFVLPAPPLKMAQRVIRLRRFATAAFCRLFHSKFSATPAQRYGHGHGVGDIDIHDLVEHFSRPCERNANPDSEGAKRAAR